MKRMMLAACFALLTACGVADEVSDSSGASQPVEVGQTEAELWTGWTSEENATPLTCLGGYIASGAECQNAYCDEVRFDCTPAPSGATFGASNWSQAFSEETPARECGQNEWVTGLDCNDGYCDNVKLRCTYISGKTVGYCYWSPWITNGDNAFQAPAGHWFRGAQCMGWWCEKMRWLYCQMN